MRTIRYLGLFQPPRRRHPHGQARSRRKRFLESLETRRLLAGVPILSEVLASNDRSLFDEDGEDSDYIEIANIGDEDMSLDRYYLTDDPENLRKWRFPDAPLPIGDFLIVFASNKDRNDPSSQLHTNFRLSSRGEYLALVEPDGETIASAFAPGLPQQVTDVSYGIPSATVNSTLLDRNSEARLLIPNNDAVDPVDLEAVTGSWLDPNFDDSTWSVVQMGVGFGPSVDPLPLLSVADSRADWVNVNEQGVSNHWYYGFYNLSSDADGIYHPDDFQEFLPEQFTSTPTSRKWEFQDGSSETRIERNNQQGYADDSKIQWGIRRWVSQYDGTLIVEYDFAKSRRGGDGTTARILHNGVQVDSTQVEPNDRSVETRSITIPNVRFGDALDFAVDPLGPGGDPANPDGENDLSRMRIRVARIPAVTESISTNIGPEMLGISASAYLRQRFQVDSRADLDEITLRIQYDDGFVAYLNGTPIVSRNAPVAPSYASTALGKRTAEEATIYETFNLTERRGLFFEGENVLQIHALNVDPADPTFLVQPELTIKTTAFDTQNRRFFAAPTPGATNGVGADIVGPLVYDSTHSPNVPAPDKSIVVTASVAETFNPIESVVLSYRVMYGDATQLPMRDDGVAPDDNPGDLVFTAEIPAGVAEPGQMVRWMITTNDSAGTSERYPPFLRPTKDENYRGTVIEDPAISSKLDIFQLFMPDYDIGDIPLYGTRGSIFFDGEFYSNVEFSLHGQTSGSFPKQGINLNFPNDHRLRIRDNWPRTDDVNFLTNYADKSKLRNTLAYEQRANNGSGSHFAFPIHARNDGEFVSVYDLVEDANEAWLERIGFDPNADTYKMDSAFISAAGGVKKTSEETGDEALENIVFYMRTSGTEESPEFRDEAIDYTYDHVNLARMANYLAGYIISSNTDCCHKNYYSFRDSRTDEWWLMAWDLELSYGHVFDSMLGHFSDRMRPNVGLFPQGNHLLTRLYTDIPGFRDMYLRRVRTLMDDFIKPPGTPEDQLPIENRIKELIELVREDAALDNAALPPDWDTGLQSPEFAAQRIITEYLAPRREFLYTTQTIANGGLIPEAQNGNPPIEITQIEFNPQSRNQLEEFVVLTNPTDTTVDISDWTLGGDIAHTFDPGTVLLPGGSIYVAANAISFRARSEGPTGGMRLFVQGNYEGTLPNEGGTVRLLARDGTLMTETSYTGSVNVLQNHLRIGEVMYHPLSPSSAELSQDKTLIADDFEWIEVVNISQHDTIDLRHARFVNGVQFDFANSRISELGPGQQALLVRNEEAFNLRHPEANPGIAGLFAANTALRDSGERITLTTDDEAIIVDFAYSDLAHQGWPQRADGHGSSLEIVSLDADPQEPSNWRASVAIGGSPGTAAASDSHVVVINEVLSRPIAPAMDQIELFNPDTTDVDLTNFYLSDASGSLDELQKLSLAGLTIPAGEFLVVTADQFNAPNLQNGFALSGTNGDQLFLTYGNGGAPTHFADAVTFGPSVEGETFGRILADNQRIYPNNMPTLGGPNSRPRVGPLIISEIAFASSTPTDKALEIYPAMDANDLDFIEIYNPTDSEADLSRWALSLGVTYDFPADTRLASQAVLLVLGFDPSETNRLEAFKVHYGFSTDINTVGGYTGQLNRSGEGLRLLRAEQRDDTDGVIYLLEDEIVYRNQPPWPNVNGESLNRSTVNSYGNDAESWQQSEPTPGQYAAIASGDLSNDGSVDLLDVELLHAAALAGDPSGDLSGDGMVNTTDLVLLVEGIMGSAIGDVDGDGLFTSEDIVHIFTAGGYEDAIPGNANYTSGDWDLDGDFSSDDLVFAMRRGGYTTDTPNRQPLAAAIAVSTDRQLPQSRRESNPVRHLDSQRAGRLELQQRDLLFASDNRLPVSTATDDKSHDLEEILPDLV